MVPIVDTHQHLWDLSRFHLPWLDEVPELKRDHLTRDYLAAAEGLNVVKTVYMEVDVAPEQQVDEADGVIDLCARYDSPTVAAVISGRPASPDFAAYIRRFAGSPYIVGVRQVLHVPSAPPGLCLEPQFVESMQLLGDLGLHFEICMRPGELSDAVELVERCSQTRFIVDHCGNADPYVVAGAGESEPDDPSAHTRDGWMEALAALAAQPNTACKISGIIARARPGWTPADLADTVNHCLDTFGPDRVVFGGDWPVCNLGADTSLRAWVEALKEIVAARSPSEQRKLFHDNGVNIYRLA